MVTKSLFKKVVNAITLSSFLVWNFAVAAPQGGSVVAGSAAITQSGTTTTINQASQNTVINWSGFNTASGETVKFNQPNASAIALNRINSASPTTFNGNLFANGQVWLINPNGIVFGTSSVVNVAGLVATTHDIANADFMAGNYQFTLADPNSTASVINNGTITIADDGIAALVAPNVANNGTIIANLGKVSLSTGSEFVLDMYGDSLINFGTSAPIANGSVSNSGLIQATGGKVYMTANTASSILDNVISMSGTIEATTATTGQHGEIILNGGEAGTVKVSGTLNASNGGSIETSGYVLDLEPTAVINAGAGGSWLLDPADVYITTTSPTSGEMASCVSAGICTPSTGAMTTNIYNQDIDNLLNGGTNVTIVTTSTGTGPLNGTITVNAPIVATTGSGSLTLTADNSIIINQPITINGSLTLNAPPAAVFPLFPYITINAPITVGGNFSASDESAFGEIQINANIAAGGNQQYDGAVFLLQDINAPGLTAGGFIDFNANSTINSYSSYASLTVTADNYVEFDAPVEVLNNLIVNAPEIKFDMPVGQGEVLTTGDQTYNGTVVLLQNMDGSGLENLTGPGTIAFNGPVISMNGNFNLTTYSYIVDFNGIVGGGATPLGTLDVSSDNVNIGPNVTSITTVGQQNYSFGFPGNSLMTVSSAATFTGSNLTFNLALLLMSDTTFIANGVGPINGNVNFSPINSVTPVNVFVYPNSAAGGTATFTSDIGVDDPLSDNPNPLDELASLTVYGTSVITDGEGNPIYFYTVGNQTYTDTVTLNLNVGLGEGIAPGVYMYSTNTAPSPVGTNAITFGAGPSGTDIGVVEGTNGPQALTVVTNNPNNGPFVQGGQGITGSVDVTSLTLGGPGGAMISSLANPNSIVGGAGGAQARVNTIIAPDFSSINGAVYCVNGAFSCVAQPPVPPTFYDIPPTQIFALPYPPDFCNLTTFECKHVEYIFRNLIVGNVATISGRVKAIRENGEVHWLKKGDYIYSYEKVVSSQGADVDVYMYSSGQLVDVPQDQARLFLFDEVKKA